MKKRTLSIFMLVLLIFTVIPFAGASAAQTSVQVTGQGNLYFSGYLTGGGAYYGPEGTFTVTNSSGAVVFSKVRASNTSPAYFSFTVPNLPYDTYTIVGHGDTPNTSVTFTQSSF
ncbi:hypothetical protein J2Z69_001259 [Paenibacillus shirakamiensis]|uniref:Uncharacterized protein n=1 Tax=Paenibacillus shirakamiensis TaxID=1265935 RepID=A0ABS4JEV0_9BACL|nr:hypothetical protein [Paenibacillus shirakamiensis]MBP2000240.1 hypothetical protein [Paenibacillus shirakamiensis]